MENKSLFLSICYLLLPCCFSPVFVKASREAEILRGRCEQGSAAWELPLPPSDFGPPVNSSSSSSSSSFCLSCAPFFLKVRTQGLQVFFAMHCMLKDFPRLTSLLQCILCSRLTSLVAMHCVPKDSKAYKSSAMHCTSKASKAYTTSTMHCGPNLTSLSQCTVLNSLLQYFVASI